jgi:valyl-tRNA synthetase
MSTELSKTYDPAAVEAETNRVWLEEKCFAADPAAPGEPYTIVIPPPNVTGALHLGHAINNTLQDILIRVHRMRGFNTLWIPGVDHAGIATQAVVEKQLKEKENKTRHDVGREELVRRIWEWKEQYGNRIVEQLKRLGCSCDWDRARFTLDEMCARAVRETFFKLFKDGLIYRGKRLVNWDVHLQTSVSDDEIYHETVKTSLWHIRYPIVHDKDLATEGTEDTERKGGIPGADSSSVISVPSVAKSSASRPSFMSIATTRPETLLGDTAVAVHSEDPRWNWAIGKFVELPLTGRKIPIIADDILVDPKFGTGVVKVTPAHDPNDYAVWQRQNGMIEILNILNPDGRINDNGGKYAGMKRDAARKKVVEDLTALGLLEKEEPYETQVGHSDRSKTPIEPYLSDQWFVKMAPLAEPALEVVRNGTIKFFPERHAQQYLSWLGEKRDWPISRQLWWGHRIPVWTGPYMRMTVPDTLHDSLQIDDWQPTFIQTRDKYKLATHLIIDHVTKQQKRAVCVLPGNGEIEKKLEQNGYVQDSDVLDTWFSSALWPHSTLGWPEQTPELKKYYPTSVLVTARDIITLWVARMVMMGMYNMGSEDRPVELQPTNDLREAATELNDKLLGIPFKEVAINPTILDGKGERMSKSKGNGVDPVDVIDTHGADALRFTLALMATETQDVRMPVKKDAQGRNTSDKFDIGRTLAIKLWNAARLVLPYFESIPQKPVNEAHRPEMAKWIIWQLSEAVRKADAALEEYRFDQYAKVCYDFLWRDFCDWYLEAFKLLVKNPSSSAEQIAESVNVLAAVLDGALRLLHPVIPFITEKIWWQLNEVRPQRGLPGCIECPPSRRLIKAAWLKVQSVPPGEDIGFVQHFVSTIREIRNQFKVDPKARLAIALMDTPQPTKLLHDNLELIEQFAVCTIKVVNAAPAGATRFVVAGCELFLEGMSDQKAETEHAGKQREDLIRKIAMLKARLENPGYIAKAPAKLVEETKAQLAEAEAELAKLG